MQPGIQCIFVQLSSRHFPLESFYFTDFLRFYYFMAWKSSRLKTNLLVANSFLVMFLYRRSICPIRLKRIKRRPNSSLIIYSVNFLSLHTSIYFCTELVQAEPIILIKVFLFYWLVVLGWIDQHQSASVH